MKRFITTKFPFAFETGECIRMGTYHYYVEVSIGKQGVTLEITEKPHKCKSPLLLIKAKNFNPKNYL